MLGKERRNQILNRVRPLFGEIDPEFLLLDLVLDSTRQQLAFVLQKGEWPAVVGINWLDYVSHRDEELKQLLAEGLRKRVETARRREAGEDRE